MSFQQARLDLAAAVNAITESNGWQVTTETEPDIFHKLIVVGHAVLIEPDTFKSYSALLAVTVWVSEADDEQAADLLYELVSPGPDSLLTQLPNAEQVRPRIQTMRVRDVGRREEGPSGFLAADLDVTMFIDAGQHGEEVW